MKADRLLNLILRGCVGLVTIYLFNVILSVKGYPYYGAVNVVTFLICAFLGMPGVLLTVFVVFLRFVFCL